MNEVIKSYQPASNWVTASLITLLVGSFSLFANEHKQYDETLFTTAELSIIKVCRASAGERSGKLFLYH